MYEKGLFLLKGLFFLCAMAALYYSAGYIILTWLKMKCQAFLSVLVGFIFHISLFELVALPFMLKKGSFYEMIAVFGVVLLLFYVVCTVIIVVKMHNGKLNTPKKQLVMWWKELRQKKRFGLSFFHFMFFILLLIHLAGVTGQQITMGDDAYYVSLATYAVEHDSLETNTMYITTGWLSEADLRPNISAWEFYVGCLAVVFHLHPAQMFHFLLPLLLIPMSYMAYGQVIRSLFPKEKWAPYLMWFSFISQTLSFSAKLNNYNMFNCPWMGKVVLYNILLPMFLFFCIQIMTHSKETVKYWVGIVFIMCAGICTTVVGVYMIPVYYAVVGITYAVTIRSKEEFKRLMAPALITIIPALVVLVIVLFTPAADNIFAYAMTEHKDWMEVFINYWGMDKKPALGGFGLVLYVVSLTVIWFKENKLVKTVLCGVSIFVSLTIVNPLFIGLVSSFITGPDLYWRMFILLPVLYVLPYLPVEFTLLFNRGRVFAAFAALLIIGAFGVAFNGYVYEDKEIFTEYESTYGVPKICVRVSDYILKQGDEGEVSVIYPRAFRQGLRQYTTKLVTPMGRNYYHQNIPTDYGTMGEICEGIYKRKYKENEAHEVLKGIGVDYIVVKNNRFKNKNSFKKMKRFGKYALYRVI